MKQPLRSKKKVNNDDFLENWYKNRKVIKNENNENINLPDFSNLNYSPVINRYEFENPNEHGYFDTVDKSIGINTSPSSYVPGILTHEKNHFLQDQLKDNYTKYIENPISNINQKGIIPEYKKALGERGDYLFSPDEVHSRLMQFRMDNNLKPDDFIDEEKLKTLKNRQLFKLDAFDDNQMLNLLNKTVDNNKNSNTNFAKYGGKVTNINMKNKNKVARYNYGGMVQMIPQLMSILEDVSKKTKNNGIDPIRQPSNNGINIESPQEALVKNDIAKANADMTASNNGWVRGLEIGGGVAQQLGSMLMSYGSGASSTSTLGGNAVSTTGSAGFMNKNFGTMAMGGEVPLAPVEVEGQEVGETPNGQLLDFQGPSHENGGIPLSLPPGTEIYSKRIKVDGVSMADRKKKRERRTVTLESLFEKNKTDALIKNSLQRTQENNQIEEDSDNKIQMVVKQLLGQQEENLPKHLTGNTVEDPTNPYGGGVDGRDPYDSILYGKKNDGSAFQLNDFKKYLDAYRTYAGKPNPGAWYNQDDRKLMQTDVRKMLGENTTGVDDGIFGKNDYAVFDKWYNSVYLPKNNGVDPNLTTDNVDRGQNVNNQSLPNNPNIDYAGIEKMFSNMPISDDASLSQVTNRPYRATPGIVADGSGTGTPGANKDGSGFSLGDIFGGMTMGDALGMAGNWYQADKIMKTIQSNRAGDTPNINAFKDYGKDGLETLDKTKQYVNQVRDEKLKDLELSRTGSIKRNSNSARSINTIRALNLATDAGVNNTKEETYNSFAEQMMSILGQQAGMENQRDQVVMQGEDTRDDRDRQDRDNYFSQLITGYKNKGQVMSETGRNLNQIKSNDVMQNLINQLSAYGITVDANGQLSSKGTKKTK